MGIRELHPHFIVVVIGLFTLKPKCSFMVMIFLALLYGLWGHELHIGGHFGCVVLTTIFFVLFGMYFVYIDGCR